MQDHDEPYVTRKQATEIVREETGIPLCPSQFDKDAMLGRAPKPAAIYGKTHLYTRAAVLEYARSLIRPAGETEAADRWPPQTRPPEAITPAIGRKVVRARTSLPIAKPQISRTETA